MTMCCGNCKFWQFEDIWSKGICERDDSDCHSGGYCDYWDEREADTE